MIKKILMIIIVLAMVGGVLWFAYQKHYRLALENEMLKKIVDNLEADSRVAEVLVTKIQEDLQSGKVLTTIKFLEYDSYGVALSPRYFTFSGNIIQFQSLVIRFEDDLVRSGDSLKGKSIFIFWKVFMLDGSQTQEFILTDVNSIPRVYEVDEIDKGFEKKIWEKFWNYALDPNKAGKDGIKNAQIEAPGTMFLPGNLYKIKIEHDGGLRIDAQPLPDILRGEMIL